MDNSTSVANFTSSSQINDNHSGSYAYKNEVSLSISADLPSTSNAPKSSPSHTEIAIPSHMEDVPLTSNSLEDTKSGFDNPGFEQEKLRSLSSFGQNGQMNDSTLGRKTTNGKFAENPLVEAVNLELVNIKKPANSHDNSTRLPVKKDAEVDNTDRYDEYFVPVNEHRKYMRGEKLYVTKDKRVKSIWRKWLCWTICLAFIIGSIIVGILATMGVILSSEPTPFESRQFSDNGQFKSAGTFGIDGRVGKDTETTADFEVQTQAYPSTIIPTPPTITDENIVYVRNTLEGQITLSNLEFLDEYNDHQSQVYTSLTQALENVIKESLFPKPLPNEVYVKIMNLKSGSVVVDYRVSWSKNVDIPPLTQDTMKNRLHDHLTNNNGYISMYLVPTNTIRVARLPDTCAMKTIDLNCGNLGCHYNEKLFDFVCHCQEGMEYDFNSKICISPEPSIVEVLKKDGDLNFLNEISTTLETIHYFNNQDHLDQHHNENETDFNFLSDRMFKTTDQTEPAVEPETPVESDPYTEPEPSSEMESTSEQSLTSDIGLSAESGTIFKNGHVLNFEQNTELETTVTPDPEPMSTLDTSTRLQLLLEPESSYVTSINHLLNYTVKQEPSAEPDPASEREKSSTLKPSATSESTFELITSLGIEMNSTHIESESSIPSTSTRRASTAQRVYFNSGPRPKSDQSFVTEPSFESVSSYYEKESVIKHTINFNSGFEPETVTNVLQESTTTSKPKIENDIKFNLHVISMAVMTTTEINNIPETTSEPKPSEESEPFKETEPTHLEPLTQPEPTSQIPTSGQSFNTESSSGWETSYKLEPAIKFNFGSESELEPDNAFDVLHESLITTSTLKSQATRQLVKDDTRLNVYFITTEQNVISEPSSVPEPPVAPNLLNEFTTESHSQTTNILDKSLISNRTEVLNSNFSITTGKDVAANKTNTSFKVAYYSATLNHTKYNDENLHLTTTKEASTKSSAEKNFSTNAQTNSSESQKRKNEFTFPIIDTETTLNSIIETSTLSSPSLYTTAAISAIKFKKTETALIKDSKLYLAPTTETEDVDDIPITTDHYIKQLQLNNETNNVGKDMNFIEMSKNSTKNELIDYSTTTELVINKASESVHEENMSPFLPHIETSTTKQNGYAVTDIVSENFTTVMPVNHSEQSPFLPEIESNVKPFTELHYRNDIETDTQNIYEFSDELKMTDLYSEQNDKQTAYIPKTTMIIPETTADTILDTKSTEKMNENVNKYSIKKPLMNFRTSTMIPNTLNSFQDLTTMFTEDLLLPITSASTNITELSDIFNLTSTQSIEISTVSNSFSEAYDELENKREYELTTKEAIYQKYISDMTSSTIQNNINNTFTIEEAVTQQSIFDTSNITKNNIENIIMSDEPPIILVERFIETETNHFSKCAAGQFECINGKSIKDGTSCINLNERCDAISHCTDNSDEYECERLRCPGHFQCNDGPCLARHLVCDGIAHCNDSSDETDCNSWQCRFDEISCAPFNNSRKGPCIPSLWQCDGMEHCPNGSDEMNCPDNCNNNEFYCTSQRRCIPEVWKCDGNADCSDGEDERPCDCAQSHFKCHTGGCIPQENVCDGLPHCPDLSDEWECLKVDKPPSSNDTVAESWNEFQKKLFQIKQSNGQFALVCSDDFDLSYADNVCHIMGYARSLSWSSVSSYPYDSILYSFKSRKPVEKCSNGAVSLNCLQFECGNSQHNKSRTMEGDNLASEEVPSLALIFTDNIGLKCTASIVAPKWALASYSCIIGRTEFINDRGAELNWRLFAGSSIFNENLSGLNDTQIQVSRIKRIVVYPQAKYKRFLFTGDFVLLELEKALKFTSTVSPACLAEIMIDKNLHCMTAGWGVQKIGVQGQYFKSLQTPIITKEECNSTMYFAGALQNGVICSNSSVNDTTCYNDEGAPVMCLSSSSNKWVVQGILSYHGNCGRRPQPSIYNSLSSRVIYWIRNTVGNDRMIMKHKLFQ